MFSDSALINHIQTNNSIKVDSLIIAEWNQNILTNIQDYGSYRYRPGTSGSVYSNIFPYYDGAENVRASDPNDTSIKFYADSLKSTIISQYRTEDENEPLIFLSDEAERQLYYSLKDCFNPFRPRSGINKILFFNGKFVDSIRSARRPRYYFSSRKDQFKYWTSYRKDNGLEVGISTIKGNLGSIGYFISDAAPFVVYKEEVATNRIVVKMQTNLADPTAFGLDRNRLINANIRSENSIIKDPLIDITKSSIPKRWKIQYLNSDNNWIDAVSFDETSKRRDESNIVPWDGYVEIAYGIKIPKEYKENFYLIDYISSSVQLPLNAINGQAYVLGSSETNAGDLYIWNSSISDWDISGAEYGFSLSEDDDTKRIGLIKKFTNPNYFIDGGSKVYKDFLFIKGIRIVVETMYAKNATFDLIEMSPRLKANITDQVIDFDITKNIAATDYGLPVGGLAAGTGNIRLSNSDGSFTELNIFNKDDNTGSIIANNLRPQVKFDFYETILDVGSYDKFIPLKTLYSEDSIVGPSGFEDLQLTLRDAFFRLESAKAASLFIQNCTLTTAVAIMLDNIGFSNYIFKGISSANDPAIPFFFVEPDVSVAEVLQRLAISTQTAIFFDEYNNLVIMPKEYLMPDVKIRDTNDAIQERLTTLYGQKTDGNLPNIESISGFETSIINDGQINYTTRYIQREVTKLEQAQLDLRDRTYGYKSSILWESGDQESIRTINQPVGRSGFALGAVTLNTDLTSVVPYVTNNQIVQNIIDIGADSIYWLPRFQGYLYANGEIIRYDAQEYSVSGIGNVWITNNSEYQKYFSKLPFNGSMWLTGRLRIFVEPFYENVKDKDISNIEKGVVYKNGKVKAHGRGQFGTQVVTHSAKMSDYWRNVSNRASFRMDSTYLFSTTPTELLYYPELGSAQTTQIGRDDSSKTRAEVTDKIVNFMRKSVRSENNSSTSNQTNATMQSSALILSGPKTFTTTNASLKYSSAKDVVTYIYKDLTRDYKHVGARLRIIGVRDSDNVQNPQNSIPYFNTTNTAGQSSEISGASGGIGYMIDKNTNSGYYFEIAALNKSTMDLFTNTTASTAVGGSANYTNQVLHNIMFYKVSNKKIKETTTEKAGLAVPIKLWGSTANILVDDGNFVGMDRLTNESTPTVYDLAIESEKIDDKTYKFYLYINNELVATVIDKDALPSISSNVNFTSCLFVRASSKCMFEYFYALKNRANQTNSVTLKTSQGTLGNGQNSILSTLANNSITIGESLRKYAMSGVVQSTYLSSIGTEKPPGYDIYFEEFGTIMRECVYFNIKYDQAYPALVAQLVPTFSAEKSYVVSGFIAGSYGAEFLIFNSTDKAIDLSEGSINRLIIQGITFTQDISNILTVDDYFKELSNMSDPVIVNGTITSPQKSQKIYDDIKSSRSIYGNKSFSLDSLYIQNEDSAKELMSWIIDKTLKPRKIIEIDAFAIPHVQLGDIIKIDYDLPEGVKLVDKDKRFVAISLAYGKSSSGIKNQIRLLEV